MQTKHRDLLYKVQITGVTKQALILLVGQASAPVFAFVTRLRAAISEGTKHMSSPPPLNFMPLVKPQFRVSNHLIFFSV
jgi:hypothetical protein